MIFFYLSLFLVYRECIYSLMFTWQQSFSATDGLTPGGLFEATDLLRPFGSSLIHTHSLGALMN